MEILNIERIAIEQLNQNIEQLKNEIDQLKELVLGMNKFYHFPAWITTKQALEILPFDSKTTLAKYAGELIQVKQVSPRGDLAYSKKDCLLFQERYETFYQKKFIEPSQS